MQTNKIVSYSISLWDSSLVTVSGASALQETKLCDLGSSESHHPGDAQDPKLTLKSNGEALFSFTIYTKYFDIVEQEQVLNPYKDLIVAERKVKVNYDDVWYDFIIKKITYDNTGKKITVECNEAFTDELGHTGYTIELDTELENNLGSVFELGKAITENSDWRVLDPNGVVLSYEEDDCYIPTQYLKNTSETLYSTTTLVAFNAYRTTTPLTRADIPLGSTIYVPYSCIYEGIKPFQFYYNNISYSFNCDLIINNGVYCPVITDTSTYIATSFTETQTVGLRYFSSAASDLVQEVQEEYLYRALLKQTITAYEVLNPLKTKTFVYNPAQPIYLYIFQSCLTNTDLTFSFIQFDSATYSKYVDLGEVIRKEINYKITVSYPEYSRDDGLYIPTLPNGSTFIDEVTLDTKLRADRYVSSYISHYDALLDKYIDVYKLTSAKPSGAPSSWTVGDRINRYVQTDYLTPDSNRNLITNCSGFINTSGWLNPQIQIGQTVYTKPDDPVISFLTQGANTYSSLILGFDTLTQHYTNSGFTDSKNFIDGISGDDYFVLKMEIFSMYQSASSKTWTQELVQAGSISNISLRCKLQQYRIKDDGTYELINNPLIDFDNVSTVWHNGYTYKVLTNYDTTGNVYAYEEATGLYRLVTTPLDRTKTYYEVDTQFVYAIAKVQTGTYSYDELYNQNNKFGFFITSKRTGDVYVRDFEVFRFIPKDDGAQVYTNHIPFLPNELKPSKINTTYCYYKKIGYEVYADEVVIYKSDTELACLEPVQSEKCEKRRSITVSKSNRYNILATLCETFQCWLRIEANRDSEGKLILQNRNYYDQLTSTEISQINQQAVKGIYYKYNSSNHQYIAFNADSNNNYLRLSYDDVVSINAKTPRTGTYYYKQDPTVEIYTSITLSSSVALQESVTYYEKRTGLSYNETYYRRKTIQQQEKYIVFKANIGDLNYAGFKYGVNLTNINRTIESDKIVTKLIVEENQNDYAAYGFCAISQAASNTSGESFIYNFNNFVNRKIIDGNELTADITKLNNKLKLYNTEIAVLTTQDAQAAEQVSQLKADADLYNLAYEATIEEINQEDDWLKAQTGQRFAYWRANTQSFYDNFGNSAQIVSKYENLVALQQTKQQYQNLATSYQSQYAIWYNKLTNITTQIEDYGLAKTNLIAEFELKYANYLREGTWESDDYDNPELYYLDACNTSEDNAYPKVTYKLNVVDVSGLEEYQNYAFAIGDRTYIEDIELFGYKTDGITPLQKDVVITELVYVLDNPSKNTVSISTFRSAFNDLFSRFSAVTQKVEYNQLAYDRAASAVNTTTGFTASLVQKSFENNNIAISQAGDQSVLWDEAGIQLTSKNAPNNIIRLIGQGIFLSNDSGTNWQSALTANGFNASLFSSGILYTSKINIVDDSNNSAFKWDHHGISAYSYLDQSAENKVINEGKFVRFDKFGIYGYNGLSQFEPENEEQITEDEEYTDDIAFSLTWSGLRIATHHLDYVDGIATKRGGIQITSNDDFRVLDADENERIKIGVISTEDATPSNPLQYGMRLKNANGDITLVTKDDGTLWLKDRLLTGGSDGYNPKTHLGVSGRYKGWTTVGGVKQPIAANPGEIPTFSRVLYVAPEGINAGICQGDLQFQITAYETLETSNTKVIQPTVYTKLYVNKASLVNKQSPLQFYIMTAAELAQALQTRQIPSSCKSYSIAVTYGNRLVSEGYYIPKVNDNDLITSITQWFSDGTNEFTVDGKYYSDTYKFELYDDGTFRTPGMMVDNEGNLSLEFNNSVLYAPTIKSSKSFSLTSVEMNQKGLQIYSKDSLGQPNVDYLRAELAVTEQSINGSLYGINPYVRLIPNLDAARQETVDYWKVQGLVKAFPHGLWIGNGGPINMTDFTSSQHNEGIFIQFAHPDISEPRVKLIHGNSEEIIATSETIAVFA